MKFITNESQFKEALNIASLVVKPQPIVPILENVWVLGGGVQKGECLELVSSDLQNIITYQTDIKIGFEDSEKSFLMPTRPVLDYLKRLDKNTPLTFNYFDGSLEIISENKRAKYNTSDLFDSDWPTIPTFQESGHIAVSAAWLATTLRKSIPFMCTDDLRPNMNGLYFEMDSTAKKLSVVSTDGHLLSWLKKDMEFPAGLDKGCFVLHSQSVLILQKLLTAMKGKVSEVKIAWGGINVQITVGSAVLLCRAVDERFPDFRVAIPGLSNAMRVNYNRMELLQAVRRAELFANKTTHQISLRVSKEETNVSAEDLDYKNEFAEIVKHTSESVDNFGMEIGFNAKFLGNVLMAMGADPLFGQTVDVKMTAPNRAAILTTEGSDDLFLIMPVMLNTYA